MKYLKTYEESISKTTYKRNQYVLIEYNFQEFKMRIVFIGKIFFHVKAVTGKVIQILPHHILRKLTPEEINQYKIDQETNKFNI